MADKRQILRTVRIDDDTFNAGDEDALDDAVPASQIKRLVEKGVITEGFTGYDDTEEGDDNDSIPDDFPGRKTLESNGITTMDQVLALTNEQIDGMTRLKPETREKVKAARDAAKSG